MSWRSRARPAAIAVLMAASLLGGGQAKAQAASSATTSHSIAPPRGATRVLAIGSLTAKATAEALPAVLEREVPATLQLYLQGSIDDWYAKPDQTGVVFILNVTTVDEARALLDPLPLGRAGMMTFTLTPIGPLRPLGILLGQKVR